MTISYIHDNEFNHIKTNSLLFENITVAFHHRWIPLCHLRYRTLAIGRVGSAITARFDNLSCMVRNQVAEYARRRNMKDETPVFEGGTSLVLSASGMEAWTDSPASSTISKKKTVWD